MGWNETSVKDERYRFVVEYLSDHFTMSEICARFGVSRVTGYKWIERFRAFGLEGLSDRSSAPLCHGRRTPDAIREAIIALRDKRPDWGPKKIVGKLADLDPGTAWPAPSTAGGILKEAGLIEARRKRFRVPPRPGGLTSPLYPNHVWAADHKGWVTMRDGRRCEPLTVTDGFSRYLIALAGEPSKSSTEAIPLFLRAFKEHGLPERIRTDNGVPFAAAGVTGLTALSLLFIRLGIEQERIEPGKPQQNGRHERFHATLAKAMKPPSANLEEQQQRFEAFRKEYNEERPHEALGQKPPARFYEKGRRLLPACMPEPDYPAETAVRIVRQNGEIKWAGSTIYVSQLLEGQPVAVEEADKGLIVRYFNTPLGMIDPAGKTLRPIKSGKPRTPNV